MIPIDDDDEDIEYDTYFRKAVKEAYMVDAIGNNPLFINGCKVETGFNSAKSYKEYLSELEREGMTHTLTNKKVNECNDTCRYYRTYEGEGLCNRAGERLCSRLPEGGKTDYYKLVRKRCKNVHKLVGKSVIGRMAKGTLYAK